MGGGTGYDGCGNALKAVGTGGVGGSAEWYIAGAGEPC